MKRTVFFIVCIFFATTLTFGQAKPVATFAVSTYDFGEISEEGGNVSCDFIVKNTGDAPLVISKVTASCGCTTPDWTKEPIAPGASGKIKATYSPQGRPGPFSKTITVFSNTGSSSVMTIKGTVTPKKLSPEEAYPFQIGSLRLKQTGISLGAISNTEEKTQTVEVFNNSKTPMKLKFEKLPKYITIICEPKTIPANTAGKFTVNYNAPLAKTYGKIIDTFEIIANNDTKAASANKFQVSATITDNFMTVDQNSIPKLGLSPAYINFGKLSDAGTQSTQILKISNSGSSDLIIRSIKSNTPEVVISAPKTTVKSGEIVEIKLIAQTKKIANPISGVLDIVTNDPNNSVKEIRFTIRP